MSPVQHDSPVKLSQASSAQTLDSVALFLVWPREVSLYLRSDPANKNNVQPFESFAIPTEYRILGAHYVTQTIAPAQCASCHAQPPFLIDGKRCSSCVLENTFKQKLSAAAAAACSVAVKTQSPWPAKGGEVPYADWIKQGCPWRYLMRLCYAGIEKTLVKVQGQLIRTALAAAVECKLAASNPNSELLTKVAPQLLTDP